MTKEEIIQDILKGMEGIGGIPSNQEFYAEFDLRLRSALGIESEIERLKAERGWISVKDRLPEFDTPVLVFCKLYGRAIYTHVFIGEFQGDKFGNWHDGKSLGVLPPTHWMPLPKEPKQ